MRPDQMSKGRFKEEKSEDKIIQEAYDDLLDANHALEKAEKEESYARSNKTSALNRVNKAQKVFDEIVSKIKATAPRDSDWNSTRNRKKGGGNVC